MKRLLIIVLSVLLGLIVVGSCVAEESFLEATDEPVYYISRPIINFRGLKKNEVLTSLTFGTQVKILERNEEYTTVETPDGTIGKVSTGFIVPCYYPIIYTDAEGVWLSPVPGLTPSDYAYGACGLRWEEKAIILFEQDGYLFIVTEEGFGGYILKDNPHISIYSE